MSLSEIYYYHLERQREREIKQIERGNRLIEIG